jgi:hypothetical protein
LDAARPIVSARRGAILLFASFVFLLRPALEPQSSRPPQTSVPPAPAEIFAAAERAMGSVDALANIRSISAIAACHGPKADYETRIISDRRGNLSFQQFFADHKNIAGILDGRGWQLRDDGRYEWIDASETFVLRGHEFPMMALDLRKRFHDFKTVGNTEFEGQPAIQVSMTDELGHPASAYFSLSSHLLSGLTVTNPRTGGPSPLKIRFDSWKLIGGVNVVSHVTILSDSEKWIFDFTSLKLNAANDSEFQIPHGSAKSPE